MTTQDFGGVVRLTSAQYNTLKRNGSLTVGSQTLTYNPATIYVTTDDNSGVSFITSNSLVYSDGTKLFSNGLEVSTINHSHDSIQYSNAVPTADNTDGLKIVVLDQEPETRYAG